VAEKVADHRHVPIPDEPVALGGRGRGQQRRQRFTGQRAALPEIAGVSDTPAGFSFGDPQPVGQRAAQCAAQLLLRCLRVELVDQRVLGCALPAGPRSRRSNVRNRSGW
jgi:hypothetical protein